MDLDIGKKLILNKKLSEALSFFLKELDSGNQTFRLYFFLGLTYFELNQIKESIVYYKLALKIEPKSINTILNYAIANYVIGNFLSAKKLFLKVIKLDKQNLRAYYGLYQINQNNLTLKIIQELKEINKNNNLRQRYLIDYLLSKYEKKNKNYELEIKYLQSFQKKCFDFKRNYNLQGLFYYNRIISKIYNKIIFKNKSNSKTILKNINPIFIIGLPRSGSTLIESMISSGEEHVISLGETAIFNTEIFNQFKNVIYKKDFNLETNQLYIDIHDLKKKVFQRYENYLIDKNQGEFFSDKSLENFFNIEAILKVFPNAKFIHTKRNYKDSAIAIYQSMLADLPWTHSISSILNYIDNYIKIINYYEKKYPSKILSINLENLTENKEFYSKKIFEFCNLFWSQQVLKFYKKKDLSVKTLSNSQVREQIFRYNSIKYKPYFNLLSGFKDKYDWLV